MNVQSQGFFLLRRPLLPIEVLQNFHQTVGDQTEVFERELIHFFAQPSMLEALYVASPELHQSFVELISGHHKGSPEKLLKTLYKYLIRMTSRSTPYGLFAGAAIGTFEDCSRITFPDTRSYTTHARLDMNYVAEMAQDLSRKEAIRRQLRFYPNTSLYRMGDSYRYVEGMLKNKKRHYILSSVEWSPYLEKLLIRARQGATICQLVEELLSDDISVDEAEAFANQIIDAQILVSELEATATGDEFFKVLLNKLAAMQDTETEVHQLREIESLLQQQDAGIEKYRKIQRVISQYFVTTGSKDLVQTDLYYHPTHCALSQRFVTQLMKDFQKIVPLAGNNEKTALETFRKKFYEKYEEKEVPLLTAIDNETGIGYGRLTSGKADNLPLLEQLFLPGTDSPETTEWSPLAKLRYKIYQDSLSAGEASVRITDAMIADLQQESADQPFLRESFYLFGNLVSPSLEKVDEGEFKFSIHAVSASSGLKLLGRFCHGSEQLTDWVKKAVLQEEARHPDAVFAEVAHLPEARVGNVVMRPFLRKYEIPYLAGTTIAPEYQILPDDLMVSVPGGKEIVLRSKRLNKRVFPRLTNAHNYFTGLPFYRFLCELPFQGKNYDYTWSWGFLSDHPFLPRIEYQHLILSRATWNLRKNDFESLKQKEVDAVRELQAIRHRLKMPRYVQVLEGESEMLIDFESVFSVQILWDLLRKYDKVRLLEFLGEPQQACVQSQNRHFTHEVIIPFIQTESSAEVAPVRNLQKVALPVQRNFLMGSKWLYLKIYAGTKTSDRLLTSVIKPLVEEMTEKGLIEKWFFLRFADPEEHLRLRFYHSQDKNFWHLIMNELNRRLQPYLDEGLIFRVQTDTYKRELERYGSSSIEEVETIFCADSVAVIRFLDLLGGDDGERYRWLTALRGTHMLLEDWGYDLPQKKQLMTLLQQNFFREFNGNTQLHYQLNDKYRANSKDIMSFMNPAHDERNEMGEVIRILQNRSASIRSLRPVVLEKSDTAPDNIVASLIHMFLNRLFISRQRVHELVIYHYLKKYYESCLARTGKITEKKYAD